MTDIFGAVGTGLQLITALINYGNSVKGAKETMDTLCQSIQNVDRTIKEINDVIQSLSDVDKMKLGYEDWIRTLNSKTEMYRGAIQDLSAKLQRNDSLRQQLKFPFRKGTFDDRVREIRWYLTIMNNFLGVLHARKTIQLQTSMAALYAMEETRRKVQEFESALAALLPDNRVVEAIDSRIYEELKKCQQSEPSWVLEEPVYLEWKSGHSSSPWLWAHGRPGVGKTCVASFVAHNLYEMAYQSISSDSFGDQWFFVPPERRDSPFSHEERKVNSRDSCSVTVFYCDFRASAKQDTDSIFRCLGRQLYGQLRNIDPQTAHRRLEDLAVLRQPRAPTSQTIKGLVQKLLQDFKLSYIVIDALDENMENFQALYQLLQELCQLPNIKLFVTSRDGEDSVIHEAALDSGALRMHIRPNEDQIRRFVDSQLKQVAEGVEFGLKSSLVEVTNNETRRNDITDRITTAAHSNYLCAQLQISALQGLTKETLQKRLTNLPVTLGRALQDTIDRIDSEDKRKASQLGRKALLWAIYARRPLSVGELSHALWMDKIRDPEYETLVPDSADLPGAQEIVESTAYALTIDKETSKIQIHKAVKDFCETSGRDAERQFSTNPHHDMAEICLRYLRLENFQSGPADSAEGLKERREREKFFQYAVENWGWHVKAASELEFLKEDSATNIIEFLEDSERVELIGQALQRHLSTEYERSYPSEEHSLWARNEKVTMPALHILVYFRLEKSVARWLKQHPEDATSVSRSGHTAVWWASRLGHAQIVRRLLECGADATVRLSDCDMPLTTAIDNDHFEVVKALLNYKKGDKAGDKLLALGNKWARYPISEASTYGRTEMFRFLLDRLSMIKNGKDILVHQDDFGHSVLHEAAVHGYSNIVEELYSQEHFRPEMSQLLRHQGVDEQTPIYYAADHGSVEIIEKLLQLDEKAQLLLTNNKGRTALCRAVEKPFRTHGKVARVLIQRGSDPCFTSTVDGRTPVHIAARWGNREHLNLLLEDEHCARVIHQKDKDGYTPLELAWRYRKNEWRDCVEILTTAGAETWSTITYHNEQVNTYTRDTTWPYYETDPLPTSLRLPVQRIKFSMTSHDQGWADEMSTLRGSFGYSYTWFDAGIRRNGVIVAKLLLTSNRRLEQRWRTYSICWDADEGDLGGGSRGNDGEEKQEVLNFMAQLQGGDRVVLMPKAEYPGWTNYVKMVDIEVEFLVREKES